MSVWLSLMVPTALVCAGIAAFFSRFAGHGFWPLFVATLIGGTIFATSLAWLMHSFGDGPKDWEQ